MGGDVMWEYGVQHADGGVKNGEVFVTPLDEAQERASFCRGFDDGSTCYVVRREVANWEPYNGE